MNRRQFVGALSGLGSALALAGCLGDGESSDTPTATAPPTDATTPTATPTPTPSDKPGGIYVQTFEEQMSMQGTATSGRYAFALMFAVPHDFWTVTGDTVSKTTAEERDSLHLMAQVWDDETGTVLPETGLSVEISRDGELVSEEVIYPMLSQPMSFHYGGNFALPEDGTYDVTVSVGGTAIRRTGAFADAFGDPASVDVPLEFTEDTRSEVQSRPLDQGGDPGALRPMDMGIPQAILPAAEDLAGTVRGSAMTDDARFVVTTFESADRVDADGGYLAASARTRYNRYVLPAMAVDATLERGGETVFEGPLRRTLSPDLGYHYGAAVDDVQSGDELTVSTATIPQVARHEGYETAFRQMDDVTVTL